MSTKKETQEIKKTAEMNKGSNGSVNSMPSIWYTWWSQDTYRSRLKSRAIAKDSFEDDIKKIATY